MPGTLISHTDRELMDIKITPGDVAKKLSKMTPNKSLGTNRAASRVLKELQEIIAEPLYLIFRQSFDLGKIPFGWKMGLVSPIFKKGNRHQANNYRPVSLTSVICKTLESIFWDHIIHHIVENELLTKCQHGFINGRSCVTQLTEALDMGNNMEAVYLDFAKAFDSSALATSDENQRLWHIR